MANMRDPVKCLLIDDDRDDYEIFRLALSEINHHIHLSYLSTGFEAIDKLKQGPPFHLSPDLIFIDLNMPRMNGKQCLQEIRQIDRLKDTRVFIYSTSADSRIVEESQALGATGFIVKPSNFNTLVAMLDELLREGMKDQT